MSFTKEELIQYRKNQAEKSLEEAKLLVDNNFLNSAVNRLYYSCFYMITALLAEEGLKAKTHSGVKILFNKHFVKKKIISKKSGRLFSDLFDKRQEGDYQDFFEFDRKTILPLIDKTESFLNELDSIL
jgi:uncharacterized protein (UPF0332 family)